MSESAFFQSRHAGCANGCAHKQQQRTSHRCFRGPPVAWTRLLMLPWFVDAGAKRKRRAGGGYDDRLSDDSDFDDLRHIGGLAAGMRSASAKSVRFFPPPLSAASVLAVIMLLVIFHLDSHIRGHHSSYKRGSERLE